MRCLTDAKLQAAIDHEPDEPTRTHLGSCESCRTRLEQRRAVADRVTDHVNAVHMTPAAEARIRAALASSASGLDGSVRGSTSLRPTPPPSWRRAALLSGLAAAAGIVLVVYLVLPRVGAPTTLSASEILGRSLQTMSAVHGVELLEYDLALGATEHGVHRIRQLVDRDRPARFRFANYGPDGTLESAIAQDPATGRRTHVVRVDGRNYVFDFTSSDGTFLPVPQMLQAQVEAVIAMMQATSDQKLTTVETPEGRQYVVQVPPVAPASSAGMMELRDARVVINASDFAIREFEASGTVLRQPVTVSLKLIRRTIRAAADVPAADFALNAGPGDVVMRGEATDNMFGDVVGTALRALANAQAR